MKTDMKKGTLIITALLAVLAVVFAVLFISAGNARNNLSREKDELNARLSGRIDEAEAALAAGLLETPTAHQALGYGIIGDYLAGRFSRDELAPRIATATWQFARRQRTWFRHQHPEARALAL